MIKPSTPLEVKGDLILDANGWSFCTVHGKLPEHREAKAEYIRTACNLVPDTVDFLKDLLRTDMPYQEIDARAAVLLGQYRAKL